ncbi:MAG: tetratricopeptide repeat protein [Firmicutes bacterium]|nr:tetratricopeptide repeat protein [Bacillota bacterium]
MAEILLSKLMPPEKSPSLLYRERLVGVLKKDFTPNIIIITAPAGYGKTVLAFQLCQEFNSPLVWIHLDKRDNDPTHFMQFIIKGLHQHWPDLCSRIMQLSSQPETIIKQPLFIATLLINDLISSGANPVIVLDDYHEIKEPIIHTITQEIMDHLPPNVTMIMTSRTAVPLSLVRQYISGKARQINTAELNFIGDEIAEFLNNQYGPQPAEVISKIEQYTGGWPAALILAGTLISEGFDDFNYGSPITSSLYSYLASEVLEKLPPSYQKFLLETSVLKVLRPDHCNLLLNCSNSDEILKELSEKMLLLSALGEEQNTYCCHQLLRDFLLERLGDKKYLLYKHAGRLAQFKGNIVKAVEAFLKAGVDEETITAVEAGGKECLVSGHWQTLGRWLEQLSENLKKARPWLSYFEAVVNTYRGQIDVAESWVTHAVKAFRSTGDNIGLAECYLLQARLLRCHGSYKESLTLIDQAESEFEFLKVRPRFDLILEKGLSLALAGDLQSAENLIGKALEDAKESNHALAVAHLAETLGHIHYQQGRHAQALKTYSEAIKFSPDNTLPNYYIQDTIPYIYRDWGELSKAIEWAEKSIAAKERYRMIETLPSAYCALSYIYFELNDFIKVEELISKALKLQYEHGSERYFLLLNQSLLAWSRFARGHWVDARQLLDSTLTAAEEQTDLACGLVQMLIGTVYALMGSLDEAHEVLHRAEVNLKNMNFKIRLCEAYKALAYVHYARKEKKQFIAYARKFLNLAARLNFIGCASVPTVTLMEPIIHFAMEEDVEVIYAQSLLVRLGIHSHKIISELSQNPNPAVRYRIIAPLIELSDETAIEILSALSKDKIEHVSYSAASYFKDRLPPPVVSFKDHTGDIREHKLDVKTFGTFQLFSKKDEIYGWRTRKTRELMALMLHLEASASRERLVDELWPDTDHQNSSALFRTTMHYLRRQLEHEGLNELIVYQHDIYSIKQELCRMDYKTFEALITTGIQEDPLRETGAALLSRAVRLYKGDYFAEPADYSWAIPRQVRLKHLYIEILLTLARYYRTRGKHSRARDYLLMLKETDPFCEPAHRLLMQVFASLGERKALLEERTCFLRILREEIGLPPSPETETLYQSLGCHQ